VVINGATLYQRSGFVLPPLTQLLIIANDPNTPIAYGLGVARKAEGRRAATTSWWALFVVQGWIAVPLVMTAICRIAAVHGVDFE
jgi:hypothetical protein